MSYLKTSGLFDRLVEDARWSKAREIQSSLMRIGEFMKRISAIAEQLDFNRAWELIIRAAFRKWLGGNRAKGLLPEPLAIIG